MLVFAAIQTKQTNWFRKTRKTGRGLTTEREVYFGCELRHSIKPSLHSYTRHTTEVSKEKYIYICISWLEMPFYDINIESLSFNLFNLNVHEISQINWTNEKFWMQDYRLDHNGDWFSIILCHFILQKTLIIKILKQTKTKKKTIYYRTFSKDCR